MWPKEFSIGKIIVEKQIQDLDIHQKKYRIKRLLSLLFLGRRASPFLDLANRPNEFL
jgi:hypothetical protein